MRFCIILVLFIALTETNAFLKVENKQLVYNNQKIFLSGANIAWNSYARDFGSGAYAQNKAKYEQYIKEIAESGGNVIRVWVHIDGQWSPKFDSNGFATGADTQSLIQDLGELLDKAKEFNVFVILCLWNLAVKPQQMIHLYTESQKLDSYLNKVLKPMVTGLKGKKALAAWEVINEPFGSIATGTTDSNTCFDTNIMTNSGADWTHSSLHMKDVARFINLHADAIKSANPDALVTVGDSPGDKTSTTICGANCRDYYSDSCLTTAGGKAKGTLDFYQLHSYTWQGKFSDISPFKHKMAEYHSDKPVIVGEFATVCSESKNSTQNYKYLYDSGYSGALSWQYNEGGDCADKRADTDSGMKAIKELSYNGKIRISM